MEVARAQDYDRRADKPWTRLSAADKVHCFCAGRGITSYEQAGLRQCEPLGKLCPTLLFP